MLRLACGFARRAFAPHGPSRVIGEQFPRGSISRARPGNFAVARSRQIPASLTGDAATAAAFQYLASRPARILVKTALALSTVFLTFVGFAEAATPESPPQTQTQIYVVT